MWMRQSNVQVRLASVSASHQKYSSSPAIEMHTDAYSMRVFFVNNHLDQLKFTYERRRIIRQPHRSSSVAVDPVPVLLLASLSG